MATPWETVRQIPPSEGGWTDIIGASGVPFSETHRTPRVMDEDDIERLQDCFVASALRAARPGFQVLELHAADGYIFHQFLSPLSNRRTDAYGGSFENRARLLIETVTRVREVWPTNLPLLVRISATDWLEDRANSTLTGDQAGWTLHESVALVEAFRTAASRPAAIFILKLGFDTVPL
jgi:2,4-dienoyl-CoA reductase-like NADH-dependent reductase (Old Yellow Enzyme family)